MTYKVCVSVCVSGWELQTCSQEMNISFSKAYKQTGKERTEDWRWSSSRLVLCPAHSRGSQEERERARQGIHVIKGLPYKISTRQGRVLRNWYFKPYKWWEWRPQFKVFWIYLASQRQRLLCLCVHSVTYSLVFWSRVNQEIKNKWRNAHLEDEDNMNLLLRLIKLPWWDFKALKTNGIETHMRW